MPFRIVRNDITKVRADAIVNTANPRVTIGDGVERAIYEAAGRDRLLEARSGIGDLAVGEVGITPAFDLDAKYILHVSGPVWRGGREDEEALLRTCYDKALKLASDNGCGSIAFPLLATGTYGFPKEIGIRIAVDAFTAFLEAHEMEITLVVFGDESVKISGSLVDEVASYIGPAYEKEALLKEYPVMGNSAAMAQSFAGMQEERTSGRGRFTGLFIGAAASAPKERKAKKAEPKKRFSMQEESCCEAPAQDLDDVLKEIYTDSFEKHLRQLINKKGLKNAEVYAAANISKQYFSKLLKGQVKPSKEKLLALAVGLRLNMDETVDFLRIAGYALSPISQTDAVVSYFIRRGDYNVLKIDIVLFDYGLDPLSGA